MSVNIQIPDENFNFSELSLGEPSPLLNGFYYSPIKYENDLYIQTPEIFSKGGFIKTGNKNYIDLVFNNNHEKILEWFENLENRIKVLIFEKRKEWFSESSVEMSDIENIFISPIRSQKSGKQFVLRSNVESAKNSFINVSSIKVYDNNQNEISSNEINNNTKFIALLHLAGLKFSSRTFQIYIEIKQILVINEDTIFQSCLIREPPSKENNMKPIPLTTLKTETKDTKEEDVQKESIKNENIDINIENIEESHQTDNSKEKEQLDELNDNINMLKEQENMEKEDVKHLDDKNEINVFDVNLDTLENSTIKLQDPDIEHIELYRAALKKAKDLRKQALESHLEAQNIKAKYLLNVYSDSESESDYTDSENEGMETNI